MKVWFAKLLLVLLVYSLPACQPPSPVAEPTVLALEGYAGELKVIVVEKDGVAYRFLFDTGGGYTVLDKEFAGTFGCTPYGKTVGFRLSGEKVESQNCNPVSLALGDLKIEVAPKVMDLNSFLPEGLPKLAGLISLQTLQDFLITIDYSQARITIETPKTFAKKTKDMTEIPLQVTTERDGEAVTAFTKVRETPEPLWFYLDSGNLHGVLLAAHAADALGFKEGVSVSLEIGETLYETPAEVMDIIYDGVLDVEFFKAHVLALDLKNSKAWVKPNQGE